MQSLRYVLGPSFAATAPTPDAPVVAPQESAAPAKADVTVTLGTIDETAWTVAVDIPPYDLATHNKLVEIRVYLLPSAMSGMITPPSTGQAWKDSNFPVSVEDVSTYQGGANAVIPLPESVPGKHLGQIVLGYEV